ncbi:hypothetical protein ACNI3T_05595 [Christiangramia sp. ASW11-125]|uniref:hypothetical protein n=1 Tax=Christiangramia sp. ASW11-125 TaxID=3400701 RepID=UPI003AABB4BA
MKKMTFPRSILYTILGAVGLISTFLEINFDDIAYIIQFLICSCLFILGVSFQLKYWVK